MDDFSLRQFNILKIIFSHSDYVTSSAIINDLGITRRTLISDIKSINLKNELIVSSNKGYYINQEYREEVESILSAHKDS